MPRFRPISYAAILTLLLVPTQPAPPGRAAPPSADKEGGAPAQVVQHWRDMGFGMFIHWTPACELKGQWQGQERTKDLWGEWIMSRARIPIPEYEKAIKSFHPVRFDATEWVRLAKETGMKYIIITAKHHDGFAMYPSKVSAYNIKDHCGFNRDPMKELAAACRREGIGFGFYYSHRIDWHAPGGGKYKGNDKTATFDDYWNHKCLPQVNELTTNYGPLAVMWFDMNLSDKKKVEQLRALVRKNQPHCVINSRIGLNMGDYKSQKDCFVPPVPIDAPWETHMTMNSHWAWYPQDVYYKSPSDIIRMLCAVRSRGGNFLLNVGPDNTGRIPCVETVTLKLVGKWMHMFGAAIYAVQPTPLPAFPWGECTRRGKRLFLHVFQWPADGTLLVPGLLSDVVRVYPMADPSNRSIACRRTPVGIELTIDPSGLDAMALNSAATVLTMECRAKLETDTTRVLDHDFDNTFTPSAALLAPPLRTARTRHRETGLDPAVRKGGYTISIRNFTAQAAATWTFHNGRKDWFHVILEYACPAVPADNRPTVRVTCGTAQAQAVLEPTSTRTDSMKTERVRLGSFTIPAGKHLKLALQLVAPDTLPGLEIVSVTLKPSHMRCGDD